jgi:hypothetical protein
MAGGALSLVGMGCGGCARRISAGPDLASRAAVFNYLPLEIAGPAPWFPRTV